MKSTAISRWTTFAVLLITLSCQTPETKIVDTFFDTGRCIIGEWEYEDQAKGVRLIMTFTGDLKDEAIDNRRFKMEGFSDGRKEEVGSGKWEVEDIGIIRAYLDEVNGMPVKMTNCNRVVVKGQMAFAKR